MATCTNCGAKLEENGKFCVMCGTKVEGEAVVENIQSQDPIETVSTPLPQNPPMQSEQTNEPSINPVADQAVANALNNPANYPNGMPQQPIEASETEVIVPSNANIDMSRTLKEETPTLQSLEATTPTTPAKPIPKMDSNMFKSNKRPKNKSGNKQTLQIIGLVIGSIIALVLIIFLFLFLFQFLTNPNNTNGKEQQGPKLELNNKNSYRVGSKDYGYVSVPNSWVPFGLSPENQTIQYTDGAGWIVTLYSVEETTITAKGWANNIISQMNNVGATDIGIEETEIEDYIGYKLFGYYGSVSTYLAAWVLNGNDGKVHYIAIEGPERFNDFYDIIYTFDTKK